MENHHQDIMYIYIYQFAPNYLHKLYKCDLHTRFNIFLESFMYLLRPSIHLIKDTNKMYQNPNRYASSLF